ncbi:MAG: spermidine synthase-like protein [Rhodocyclales bacterium]|nr:spermidine synthase-like protein [Rhodocyclales bacterium]
MAAATHPFLEMPSPFETEVGKLLLRESPTATAGEVNALRARLLDESYDKPFVVDDGELRYLYFNTRLMQSAMRIATPDTLELRYTQLMMSFLLFLPRPQRLALIGLGGGSLLKFCHRQLPAATFTAIEIDADVIAFGEAFLLPPPAAGLQIVHTDGVAWLEQQPPGIDALLIDAFDAHGFAPALASRDFLQCAWDKLSAKGVLVINLAGEAERYAGLVAEAMAVFDEQAIVVPVPEDGNHVLLAFRERHFEPRWRWLHNHAKELRARHGLDFPVMAQKIERAARQSVARDMAGAGRRAR